MLPEVVGPVKLFGRVALPELVRVVEVVDTVSPVLVRGHPGAVGVDARAGEVDSAVAAGVGLTRPICRLVERPIVARESRA